jgi:hypothetical protein
MYRRKSLPVGLGSLYLSLQELRDSLADHLQPFDHVEGLWRPGQMHAWGNLLEFVAFARSTDERTVDAIWIVRHKNTTETGVPAIAAALRSIPCSTELFIADWWWNCAVPLSDTQGLSWYLRHRRE